MKDIAILGGCLAAAYFLFGKKKTNNATSNDTSITDATTKQSLNRMIASESFCKTCQREDGSYYTAVRVGCKVTDTCVSHGGLNSVFSNFQMN